MDRGSAFREEVGKVEGVLFERKQRDLWSAFKEGAE